MISQAAFDSQTFGTADSESCATYFFFLFFFFGWKTFKYVLLFIICATFLEHCLPVSSLGQLPYSFIH